MTLPSQKKPGSWQSPLHLIVAAILIFPLLGLANTSIEVGAEESGQQTTGRLEVFHDATDQYSLQEIVQLYEKGKFKILPGAGSSGLIPGSLWSHFALTNTTNEKITLHVEYVDHQLISLEAYESTSANEAYKQIANLNLARSFSHRPIPHNRFVFAVSLQPKQTKELLVKFGSDHMGFIFPDMRIWNPDKLRHTHNLETSLITFLIGGFFLMSLFALVTGIVIREKVFYAYSIYCFSKITIWSTVLGFTHQYLITDNYHWSFMSISGAVTILCGLIFSRMFLQTSIYIRKLDYLLVFMMANAGFLLVCALFRFTALSVISITIALLLYPVLLVVSFVRWRQGCKEAAIFGFAWSLLVFGLVIQALRDLGFVEHNIINYYWPPVASFFEMLAIMAAMGIKVRQLKLQKELAEHRYTQHLELTKADLEKQVLVRTQELEKAKLLAEHEARTDSLTGINNRRYFMTEGENRLKMARKKDLALSLLLFDIDHFKVINDNFGHAVGDEALRVFCESISLHVRESDVFGRLGGEEFALLLSEERQGTLQIAHRLQKEIADISIATEKGPLTFTASVGIAHLQPGQRSSIEELLNNADNALYVAKDKGRNQIIEHACPVMPVSKQGT